MRRTILKKVSALAAVTAGIVPFLGTFSPPAQAVPFPDRVFGCSIPLPAWRDPNQGVGTQPANALIVTPASATPAPAQGTLGIFSQVGTESGQSRCLIYKNRFEAINNPAFGSTYDSWQLDIAPGSQAICFRPPGSACSNMVPAELITANGIIPNGADSYEMIPLATGRTPIDQAFNRLTTNLYGLAMSAPNSMPILD